MSFNYCHVKLLLENIEVGVRRQFDIVDTSHHSRKCRIEIIFRSPHDNSQFRLQMSKSSEGQPRSSSHELQELPLIDLIQSRHIFEEIQELGTFVVVTVSRNHYF